MPRRRKLIVVSNRGPRHVRTRCRRRRGVARRGGGGLVTALRSLVALARRDLDRERDERRGPAPSRPRPAAAAIDERSRVTARPSGCASLAHDQHGLRLVLQRRLEPDALVPPALPLGARIRRRRSTSPCSTPGTRATRPVNETFAQAVLEELERRARGGRLLPRLPPLPRAAARRGSARPTRCSRTSSTSPGRRPTTGTCSRTGSGGAIHEGVLANDVVGFHTRQLAR